MSVSACPSVQLSNPTEWLMSDSHELPFPAYLTKALAHKRCRALIVTALSSDSLKHYLCDCPCLQEARHFQLLSDHMLLSRRQQQRQSVLLWWHLVAQDLHHHRVVLDYFRARRIRRDGTSVFWYWKDWAQDRRLERKAVVAYWNRLLVTVSSVSRNCMISTAGVISCTQLPTSTIMSSGL